MQRVLVVEDNLDIQELLKNFLQEMGNEIALAGDGVEVLYHKTIFRADFNSQDSRRSATWQSGAGE